MKKHLTLLLLLSPLWVFSQSYMLREFNDGRTKINKRGMIVLGSWATANIGVNSYFWASNPNSASASKYFYQMNTYWNVVNLGIATYAYIKTAKTDYYNYTMDETVEAQNRNKKTYLINGALDVGYIITGIYLQSVRSSHPEKRRLLGYGQSIFWQGVFLAVFDSAMYLSLNKHEKESRLLLKGLSFNGNSAGVIFAF